MIDDDLAKERQLQKQTENTYIKMCTICRNTFIGKNKDLFGICPECQLEQLNLYSDEGDEND